ncbi:ketoacyl-ACP synthase III [Shinella sp. CPCC 101442]|uniref:3-oxoacyl-ACP synthase III family protein n=1 Tax=Shinella sp. CPCC 101442 TaxID=2932265 RepID=UPI002152947F|nr:3-oxoacyl-[acyl-carrier-protein] synthase III C-terminal domain-containing protein [Shinella sp. CPCC 101442]MCR6497946.1 ketoacyl-ACP synthase III [Shinella sp. CPCC 101442]
MVPARVVLSEELDCKLGFSAGHLEKVSGVRSRYVCEAEDQIDLAAAAARLAMERATVAARDIDLVLGACGIPYQTLPATAPLVMRRLGIPDGAAAAFDVNATCLSFLSALELAAGRIATGQSRTALVFSADIASRALPWKEQPDVAALFGDGAAAVVLTAAEEGAGAIRASLMRTYPSAYEACEIGAGGTRFDFERKPAEFTAHAVFRMDGKELFRVTHRHFPRFVDDLLAAAGWSPADVDLVVPHQASPLALEHMIEQTGMRGERVVNIAARFGNQIAASIPTALDIAWRDGRIKRGTRLLLLGTSAGVSFGGMAIEV